MRIEITVGSGEPATYPLSLPRITIGSSDGCEIVLVNDGISRKHITILTENDTYYVVDQGSTNGSYMNEERIVPGKKIEFTTFFPVRLGDDVVVSLLNDDEGRDSAMIPLRDASSPPPATTTERSRTDIRRPGRSGKSSTVVSRNDLRRETTATFTNVTAQKNVIKQKAQVRREPVNTYSKKRINLLPIAAFSILGFGIYWNLYVTEVPKELTENIRPSQELKITRAKPVVEETSDLVPQADLLPKENFSKYQSDIKCVSDIELYFCNLIPALKTAPYGAVQSKLNVYLLVDGTPYFDDARKTADPYAVYNQPQGQPLGTGLTPGVPKVHKEEGFTEAQYNMGIYLFLLKHMPLLDEAKTQDLTISVAFYDKTHLQSPVKVIAFTSKGFNKLKPLLKENQLPQMRNNPEAPLVPLRNSIRIY